MKTPSSHARRPFVKSLRRLLGRGFLLSQNEWARLLGVTPAAISQWVNGRALPRPELLAVVLDTIMSSDRHDSPELRKFCELADRPARDVLPAGKLFHTGDSTVAQYLLRPDREALIEALRLMPLRSQLTALQSLREALAHTSSVSQQQRVGIATPARTPPKTAATTGPPSWQPRKILFFVPRHSDMAEQQQLQRRLTLPLPGSEWAAPTADGATR